MGDRGWRRIDAPSARHILTLLSTQASGASRLLVGSIGKGGATSAPPFPLRNRSVSAASARPEAARRAKIFHRRDLATHPDLIVLEGESER